MIILNSGVVSFSLGERQPNTESSNWYDNPRGVNEHLTDLKSFTELLQERAIAHNQRDEKLNHFFIKKDFSLFIEDSDLPLHQDPYQDALFHLDEFGQCWTVSHGAHGNSSTIQRLPSYKVVCPECGKGWDLTNITDYLPLNDAFEGFYAEEFMGKPLKEVWCAFAEKTDAMYRPPVDHRVSNPNHIDTTPHPEYKELAINAGGYIPDDTGKTSPNYLIQKGDAVHFWITRFYHKDCYQNMNNQEMEDAFRKTFEKAGYQDIRISRIANEYCSCSYCANWFLVNTTLGTIKVGWRKRVINIELSESFLLSLSARKGDVANLSTLLGSENVTIGQNYIHAWGWEKCEEYLRRIREAYE
ncbi:MAG: hypothetical protein LBO09_08065 [Candidatus Peribacteria bacterium]|jgi:hypothetical protein|nr:hypothetical protein [Candidatus Peribacteria bacterium]